MVGFREHDSPQGIIQDESGINWLIQNQKGINLFGFPTKRYYPDKKALSFYTHNFKPELSEQDIELVETQYLEYINLINSCSLLSFLAPMKTPIRVMYAPVDKFSDTIAIKQCTYLANAKPPTQTNSSLRYFNFKFINKSLSYSNLSIHVVSEFAIKDTDVVRNFVGESYNSPQGGKLLLLGERNLVLTKYPAGLVYNLEYDLKAIHKLAKLSQEELQLLGNYILRLEMLRYE